MKTIRFEAERFETADLIAEEANKKAVPKFNMLAYSGGKLYCGWDEPVVIDLAGASVDSQNIPIRLDHDNKKGVGHTTEVVISPEQITASGLISRENIFAKDVTESAKAGFPWKCSVGGSVDDFDFVDERQVRTINGQNVTGPCFVVTQFKLREISFVDAGADPEASAQVTARKDEKMENEKNVSQNAPDNLEAQQKDQEVDFARRTEEMIAAMNIKASENLERIAKIKEIGKGVYPELEAQAVKENWSADKFELNFLRKGTPASAPAGDSVQASRIDKKVLECAALRSAGMADSVREKMFDEKTLEAADAYPRMGLMEMVDLACGQTLPKYRNDPLGWLRAAYSNADVGNLISNIANKSALSAYEGQADPWAKICRIGSVNDFKEHTRVRMLSDLQYQKLAPGGKIENGSISDMTFGQKADTYAVAFSVDRNMLINDDLGQIRNIAEDFGKSAAKTIAKTVWTRFLSNPTQSDNKTFFHANRGNKFTGSTTALSYSALTTAEANFMKLKQPDGTPLAVTPRVLLVPPELYGTALTLIKSQTLNDGTTAPTGTANIHYGRFDVVTSPYLSNSAFSGYSATAWYLIADPAQLAAFEVAFLGGQQSPTIQSTDADFDTLGIRFRGYMDFGFREQDPLGAMMFAGA